MTERPLHCTIRNPVLLNITDTKSEFNSGCRIIDVSLSNIINPEKSSLSLKSTNSFVFIEEPSQPEPVTRANILKKFMLNYHIMVGEIHFKNSYVAYITVKAKCRITDSKDGTEVKWRTCVKRMRLMPNPHVEAGAQDYFLITRKNMLFELVNVSALRLILQQPSPVWKEFRIEDLKVFRSSEEYVTDLTIILFDLSADTRESEELEPADTCLCIVYTDKLLDVFTQEIFRSCKPSPLPAWLTDCPDKSGKKKIEEYWDINMGIANLEALSSNLQQLWALSEEVAAHQTNRALGRYEVDGCYEINLLSYS